MSSMDNEKLLKDGTFNKIFRQFPNLLMRNQNNHQRDNQINFVIQ